MFVDYRILEEYLESELKERKILESRYGEKILKRLLTIYKAERQKENQLTGIANNQLEISAKERRYREERKKEVAARKNEVAARKYIRENTVYIPILFYPRFPTKLGKGYWKSRLIG